MTTNNREHDAGDGTFDIVEDTGTHRSDAENLGIHHVASEKMHSALAAGLDTRGHTKSLRSKLVLSLAAMFFLFLTIDEVVRRQVIKPGFLSLERNGAIRDTNRVLAALNTQIEHLADVAAQWSIRVSQDVDRHGVIAWQRAEPAAHWRSPKVDWSAIVPREGSSTWLSAPQNQPDLEQEALNEWLRSKRSLIERSDEPVLSGITRIGDDMLVMFAAAFINTQGESSPGLSPVNADSESLKRSDQPILVLARVINSEVIALLQRQTQVDFAIEASSQSVINHEFKILESGTSTLVSADLKSADGDGLAKLAVRVPREITMQSRQTTALARQTFIFGSGAALLLLLLLLQRIVIGPIAEIRKHSERVAEHGLQTDPLVMPRDDEIGELARAFDRMVVRLGDAQTRLTQASRAAGMSQVADTVIHNVGNVLTNVNSLIESAASRVTNLRIEPIGKLADRLKRADPDGELRQAMPDYLSGLADLLEKDQQELNDLLTTLNDNVRHIHDVIRDQQHHANAPTLSTRISVSELLQEAIRCSHARLLRERIDAKLETPITGVVYSDRSLLMQIVINLIGNARNALSEADMDNREIEIGSRQEGETLQIFVRDNGCGMSAETLRRVFDAHFTTRKQGSGLGLHFCAVTLKRLGGSIRAESNGPGLGSTFTIQLPLADPSIASHRQELEMASGVTA